MIRRWVVSAAFVLGLLAGSRGCTGDIVYDGLCEPLTLDTLPLGIAAVDDSLFVGEIEVTEERVYIRLVEPSGISNEAIYRRVGAIVR